MQCLTSQNTASLQKAGHFFKKFTDNQNFKDKMSARRNGRLAQLKKQGKGPGPGADTSDASDAKILQESFLGKQRSMEIVAVKDGLYPKTKLWFPSPTFAVIVVSPVSNPEHNYIAVQTFACNHSRGQIPIVHAKSGLRVGDLPPINDGASRPGRTYRGTNPGAAAEFKPDRFGLSRLPEDLELEPQML